MDWTSTFVIVLYLGGVTAVGSLLARRASTSSGWAVAGGNMGVLMVAAGVAGTRIGGVGTYGVAGNVMQTGVWNLWYGVNTFLALALVGLFFAVPYRRLKLQTVGEIFSQRFDSRRCQWLTSLCVQTEYFIVNILEPFVIGGIVSTVLDIPFGVGVYIGAAVLITYTALGGLWGSAVTNLIHCTVVILGLVLVAVFGFWDIGGWDAMVVAIDSALAAAEPAIDPVAWWSFTGAGFGLVLAMFFQVTVHTPAASIYVNFSSAARRERDILPAFLLAGVIASVMPFLAGFVGMETLARYGSNSGLASYRALTTLALDIGPWIGGVALAAILAAVVSSGGPILLSSSTMFVRDWLPWTGRWDSARQLRAYRITTVVYGLLAATVAWRAQISSILDLLLLGFAMVVPPAVAVGYVIYWRRTTERGAFWGIVAGYGTGLVWYGLIRWAGYVGFSVQEGDGAFRQLFHTLFVFRGEGIDPSYPTTLIPLVAVPLISVLTRDSGPAMELRDDFYARLGRSTPQQPVV